jgi:hypothetical protein
MYQTNRGCGVIFKNAHKYYLENLKGREHLGHVGTDGRIIIGWIKQNRGVRV